jgi:hypothetical protein
VTHSRNPEITKHEVMKLEDPVELNQCSRRWSRGVEVRVGITYRRTYGFYALKVPVGTKDPFQLKEIGRSKDQEVRKTLLR